MNHVLQIALDRSARTVDVDGRLRVANTNISKATVNDYYGREIPGYQQLGLAADQVYRLLRDPEELDKAAQSFSQLPLLSDHVPVSAADHRPDLVIGSTGTDTTFDGTYLKSSLVVWDQAAIDAIESRESAELSCAYRYSPDMTPGNYQGMPYDGVMRNIAGNHVALVSRGRAGSDVVVADSAQSKEETMTLSRTEIAVRAALGASLQPKLAQDANACDVTPLVRGVTRDTLKDQAPKIAAKAVESYTGSLAQDQQLDAKALENIILAVDSDDLDEPAQDTKSDAKSEPKQATDKQGAKQSDQSQANDKSNQDEPKSEPAMDKQAMDKAIEEARQQAENNAIARMRAIRTAEKEVAPHIGEVDTTAMDSAEAVYKLALDQQGVDLTDVPESAYRAMVGMIQPERKSQPTYDSSSFDDFKKRFPEAQIPRSI